VPLQNLLDYLEGGETLDEFLDDFPTVSREQAIAALEQRQIAACQQAWMKVLTPVRSASMENLVVGTVDAGGAALDS
jgi:hypothetical protein